LTGHDVACGGTQAELIFRFPRHATLIPDNRDQAGFCAFFRSMPEVRGTRRFAAWGPLGGQKGEESGTLRFRSDRLSPTRTESFLTPASPTAPHPNGDFFSVHGDDAVYVAQKVFKTSSVIKYLGGEDPRGPRRMKSLRSENCRTWETTTHICCVGGAWATFCRRLQ
ncbi:MAG: hypothetical protein BJ554DRAFT_3146, partial [Olpidium bornovanus]